MTDIYDALLNGADTPADNADLVARLRRRENLGQLAALSGIAPMQKMGGELQNDSQAQAKDIYTSRLNAKLRSDALAQQAADAAEREKDRLAVAAGNREDRALQRSLQQSLLDERLNAGQVTQSDKAQVAAGKVKDNTAAAVNSIDKTIDAVDRLAAHPGLGGIYGLQGSFMNFPGGQAAGADALREALVSREGLQGMADLRSTGGSFGRTTNIEFQALQNAVAPLANKHQSVDQVRETLAKYKAQLLATKARLQKAGDEDVKAALGSTTVRQGFTQGSPLARTLSASKPAPAAEQPMSLDDYINSKKQ